MKKQKNKVAGLQKRKAISGYLFISPFIIGFLAFMVKPLFQSLYFSFNDIGLDAGSISYTWVGMDNYVNAFTVDSQFNQFLTEEIVRMIIYSIAIIVFSFFIAILLNQKFKGRTLVRAIFFLPVILASGVILGLEDNNQLMANLKDTIETTTQNISITGGIESILRSMGVGTKVFEKLFEVIDNIYDVALASGIQIIIFLSGLQTISSSLYEAASIDGCTSWESLWKITFPMISSLFLVNWVYTVVDFCMRTDNQVIKKIQNEMIGKLYYGSASAMAWVYFLIIIAFIGITSFFISKVVYYND